MSIVRRILGQSGEDRAAQFLKDRGYRILDRNFRTRSGELDLVALHDGTIVFVEVKTRSNEDFGSPELAVTPQKRQRMIKAAQAFIQIRKLHQMPCRFDVVAIRTGERDGGIRLIRDAFEIDGRF